MAPKKPNGALFRRKAHVEIDQIIQDSSIFGQKNNIPGT